MRLAMTGQAPCHGEANSIPSNESGISCLALQDHSTLQYNICRTSIGKTRGISGFCLKILVSTLQVSIFIYISTTKDKGTKPEG